MITILSILATLGSLIGSPSRINAVEFAKITNGSSIVEVFQRIGLPLDYRTKPVLYGQIVSPSPYKYFMWKTNSLAIEIEIESDGRVVNAHLWRAVNPIDVMATRIYVQYRSCRRGRPAVAYADFARRLVFGARMR